jgi:hypothetical protein
MEAELFLRTSWRRGSLRDRRQPPHASIALGRSPEKGFSFSGSEIKAAGKGMDFVHQARMPLASRTKVPTRLRCGDARSIERQSLASRGPSCPLGLPPPPLAPMPPRCSIVSFAAWIRPPRAGIDGAHTRSVHIPALGQCRGRGGQLVPSTPKGWRHLMDHPCLALEPQAPTKHGERGTGQRADNAVPRMTTGAVSAAVGRTGSSAPVL